MYRLWVLDDSIPRLWIFVVSQPPKYHGNEPEGNVPRGTEPGRNKVTDRCPGECLDRQGKLNRPTNSNSCLATQYTQTWRLVIGQRQCLECLLQ